MAYRRAFTPAQEMKVLITVSHESITPILLYGCIIDHMFLKKALIVL
jgi:hypothetical protein